MSIATLTLGALLLAIVLSMVSRLNIGLIGLVAAWIIGTWVAGDKPEDVMKGFPVSLFLTLAGVTFLFAIAEANGSFAALAGRVTGLARGNRLAIPLILFAIAALVSGVGPGAIASTALVIPLAASIGARAGLPPMLTALMVANGANAGNLSPISTVGVIANGSMTGAGLGGHAGTVMLAGFLAHALVAALAYAWFVPGLRKAVAAGAAVEAGPGIPAFTRTQLLTFAVLTLWIAAVVGLKANLALSAFAAGVALILCRVGDETKAIARMPWGVILMVCGVATLVALVESHGGMDLFSRMIAQVASAETINGVIAFVTGAISTYSSTSGVVLPTFLPMVPGLAQATGSSDPLAIALSITVGSALVDVSPLSTIGALCVAALGKEDGDPRLYVKLLCWGFAMAIVGALLCQVFAPMLSGAGL